MVSYFDPFALPLLKSPGHTRVQICLDTYISCLLLSSRGKD
jgi:hypothetical protein